MTTSDIMNAGIDRAAKTMVNNIGGPFGAVVVKDDKIISVASNTVLRDHDPTAHAEVNAIRAAGQVLRTHDLSGCTIYCTSEPCPMCLSAIIWSNIKIAYFGCTAEDAANIGFRDDYIYKFIQSEQEDENVLKMIPACRNECIGLFDRYQSLNKEIY